MILKGYKYKILPTELQKDKIEQHFGCCRLVWNLALAAKRQSWESNRIMISRNDLQEQLVDLKISNRWLYEINSQSLQSELLHLDNSYKSFFRGGGFPKFKNKHGRQSFSCPQNTSIENGAISIPKIKHIPIVLSRNFNGKIKTVTISKTPTGKYFASVLVETDETPIAPPNPKNGIGVDLGIKDFAVLSTGEKIANPRHLPSQIKRLKVLQRRASIKKKGSKNRNKANLKVALLHEKISNQRNDFLHKLSTKLISDNQTDTICVETLAVKNMVRDHNLAQAISDVSWSEFVRQLEYKAKWHGKNILKVNRFFASSKTCSNCGYVIDLLPLSMRYWKCPNCREEHDRDINAAINIKNSGMGNAGEPVELRPIGRAKKQELKAKYLK